MEFGRHGPGGGDERSSGSRSIGHIAAADFAFVIIPRFSMMAFASAIEPLRIANRLSGRDLYRWQVVSVDGRPGARLATAC